MTKQELCREEKNILYYALQNEISNRLKELSLDVFDIKEQYAISELEDIKAMLELLDKLGQQNWGIFEDK